MNHHCMGEACLVCPVESPVPVEKLIMTLQYKIELLLKDKRTAVDALERIRSRSGIMGYDSGDSAIYDLAHGALKSMGE